ncbi:PAS/PAC sensor signal transduction histidine kinase [Fibrisoma limi BUZ 3]|uniref:histidine kinase n=1 Tax=Fibrisoma limi BUZ 3 TaxID=1185876 RepID=I2GC93_9BACT|nr:PAS domain-containing protein [Fibrisoma limi]CCH51517.1 PAS/PAC sensor signal transduction histidine kinase [Fibrisoma limi BUZ 3]
MLNTFGKAIIPENEAGRLRALHHYDLIDSLPEATFNNIAQIMAQVFGTPIALISLVDEQEVVFKANVGMPEVDRTDRGVSLCSLAVLDTEPTVFEDALREPCLLANPLVTGDFGLQFYAGAPLITHDGYTIGTACVIDKQPRAFTESDRQLLVRFATLIMDEIERRRKFQQQREQEEQYKRIFLATSDAILIVDHEGRLTEANPVACRLYGYTHEDFLQLGSTDLIHPDDRSSFRTITTNPSNDTPFATESTHQHKSGRPIQVAVKGQTFTYRGRPHLMLAVKDVTLRKETEAVLQRTQILLQTALSAGRVATWLWELPTNQIYADENLADLFSIGEQRATAGLSLDEFISAIHPDDRERVQAQFRAAVDTRTGLDTEYRIVLANGDIRWVIVRAQFAGHSPQLPDLLLGVLVDITDRKLAELRYLESEEQLKLAIDAASLGTWDYDLVTGRVQWSDTCKALFGLPPGISVTADVLMGRVHPDDRERVSRANGQALNPAGDGQHDLIFRTVSMEGYQRWVHAKGKTMRNEQGQLIRFTGIVFDISEVKQSQEALRRSAEELEQRVTERTSALNEANQQLQKSNASLSEFAYVASHDLQEPLRKIQAFGDILLNGHGLNLNQEGLDMIQRMQASANRMSSLVRDLLMYSRLSTQTARREQVSLTDVLTDVIDDLELAIQDTGATIDVGELPVVEGDESQLRQLLQNLLSNALKFRRPDTPPYIHVRATRIAATDLPAFIVPVRPAAEYQYVQVTDNGIGFDNRYAERIFQVFQRLHGKSQYAGTGIGLAVCQKVVANHGGVIKAIAQPGQGATFEIYLPVADKSLLHSA